MGCFREDYERHHTGKPKTLVAEQGDDLLVGEPFQRSFENFKVGQRLIFDCLLRVSPDFV